MMIDEFIEFILTPIIPLIIQVILIYFNILSNEKGAPANIMPLLWLLTALITFPLLWGIVLQVTSNWSLVLISLCLLIAQILINTEEIIQDRQLKNKKRRY